MDPNPTALPDGAAEANAHDSELPLLAAGSRMPVGTISNADADPTAEMRDADTRPGVLETSDADSYPGYPAGQSDFRGWFAHDDGGADDGTAANAEVMR